jgi:tetratricopeptide (TPR) repeat protein
MRRILSGLWLRACPCLLILAGIPAMALDRAAWHHGDSPYRAVFEIVSAPNHDKGGVAVSVPVCGIGAEDGSDLMAFDQDGQQLAMLPLGKGPLNEALALVRPTTRSKQLYLYFGSGVPAPVHQTAFLPSLLCQVRTMPEGESGNWAQVEKLLGASKLVGSVFVDKIEQVCNPVDSTDPVFLVFEGYLRIPQAGTYTYMIVSDDAGYLFIDDKLLIERNGRNWARTAARGEFRKEVALTAGLHKIRLVLADFNGDLMAVVARILDEKTSQVLRPQDYAQAGQTKLAGVEAKHRDQPNPLFWTKNLSYLNYDGAQYTEIEVGTYDGSEAEFLFRDGLRGEGTSVRRIVAGLQSMPVRVTRRRVTAQGAVPISEVPPTAFSLRDDGQFKQYAALMLSANLADLSPSTLKGYIHLLNFREMNEDALPLYEALVAHRDLAEEDQIPSFLGLARAASRNFPDKSDKAYARAEQLARNSAAWGEAAREYVEFLLYRTKDFAAAERLLARMRRGAPKDREIMLRGLELDLLVLQGKVDEAKPVLDELLGTRELGTQQRFAAVKSNALRQRHYDLMREGFLEDALAVLHEWSDVAPVDRLHGTLPLARARYWQRIGWLDGALAELDGAILMDPLLPNLPEVELQRALILRQAGNTEKAKEVFQKIVDEYPNHPAAQQAKEAIK